jgi:FkbM family methyltransferase
MRFPSHDQVIGRSLRIYGEWAEHEIAVVSSYLLDGKAIVDVGANIGVHTVAFARRFPRSTIVAIEPHPLAYTLLSANVAENGIQNVRLEHCACGAETAILPVPRGLVQHGGETNLGATSLINLVPDDATNSLTLVRRLDDILSSTPIQFIKVDVEGMEPAVLAGASNIIRSQLPLIYFEARTIEGVRECRAALDGFGYYLHWLLSNPFNRANFRQEPLNIWAAMEVGVLAVPKPISRLGCLLPVTGEEQTLPGNTYAQSGWDGKVFR